MIKNLVVASNNSAKTREIQGVFAEFDVSVVNYRELIDEKNFPTETVADQYTNALNKARYIQQFLPNNNILADDTGAYFTAFPERFGLTTSRELKALGLNSVREEDAYLLDLYKPILNRGAYLEALFVLITSTGKTVSSVGRGGVLLAKSERGKYAVGFDTLFEAENGKTLAEMPMAERVLYSHRGRAAQKLLQEISYDC
ncbi:non-canonical purine NTP pyrophosphatase [Leuconostoc sp. MS02]|uniref:Non-canonical purine NTP pyrophosphatase n=1 Tax=Leuconostoc aquikimchii TaxID=3236804 RepID=A0ABV3S5V7_9LACO